MGRIGPLAVVTIDGRAIAVTGCEDGCARLWDVAAARPIGSALAGHAAPVRAVAATVTREDRAIAVTGGNDGVARVWDLRTHRPLTGPLLGHRLPVTEVAVAETRDGLVAITRGLDGTVRLWPTEPGAGASGAPLLGATRRVTGMATLHVNRRAALVTTGRDGITRLWDLASRRPVHELAAWPRRPGVCPAGRLPGRSGRTHPQLSAGRRAWDVTPHRNLADAWACPPVAPFSRPLVVTTPAGPAAVVAPPDGSVRVWDLAGGRPIGSLPRHRATIVDIATSAVSGRTAGVMAYGRGGVAVWDLADRRLDGPLPLSGDDAVTLIALPGRPLAAVAESRGSVRLWDLAVGEPTGPALVTRVPVTTMSIATTECRSFLITSDVAGARAVWDLNDMADGIRS